ncbi:hypothetical protein ZIOFF_036041 [Zingiber officinale]|uniref:Uncharacterized protein n=1 Tax=Zingiber officinale TaxID=94328 RepID=A0A8J5GPP9_ZINOF|nr:hypothetical protein ZIOFF_036041 [Zingiber officinale]
MLPCYKYGLQKLQIKLRRLKEHLKWWNEDVFGNIHDKVKLEEERYAAAKKKFDADHSVVNRIQMGESQASLFKTLHMEEMFWKQKEATKWMGEGDRNIKLFHNLIQKRRLAGRIFRIWERGSCLEKAELIQASGLSFFENLLANEEIKQVVWDIHEDGVAGPDGFSVAFYKECWEPIKEDVFEAVLDFFNGGTFPRGMAATTLVLIQKVRGGNMILKLDMAKVYDRVQWAFLLNVMKAFSVFLFNVIDVVYWRKPNCGFKLNTDGCAKGNPGLSFYGAIVRDHEGKVIFAWHGLIGMGSNLRAELFGILKGLELCIDKHLFPLWLESDSLVALKILQFSWFCWEIRNMVIRIQKIIRDYCIRFSHVYGEANVTAEYLVNQTYRGPTERILGGHEIDRNLLGFVGWDWIVLSKNFIIGAFAEGRIYNFDDLKVIVHSVPEVVFVNSKLSDKLEQQMRDPLQDGSISTSVFVNGSLEVEYAEEVGTGLGHTMEFYTLVSHEFQKAGLGMWREDLCCNVGDSEFVSAPLGLFPRPWSTTTGVLGGIDFSDVIETFLLLCKRVAKAIKDRRILDIPFSSCFYKIMLEQSFDPELGMTLLGFQAIVNRKRFVESVSGESHRSPKVLNIESLEEYVALVVDATIGSGIASQVDAFKSGFNEVFPLKALQIFTKDELEELLCGEQDSWDGCPLVLTTSFYLQLQRGSCDADLDLPSVMTCANYLKIPLYSTKYLLLILFYFYILAFLIIIQANMLFSAMPNLS